MTIQKHILHVDDQIDALRVVKRILEREGYKVTSTTNTKKALHFVTLNDYDLAILDVIMPELCGWHLFTRMRKIKPNINVMYSSVLEIPPDLLAEIKQEGVKDFVTKPFDNSDFVARVKKAL